MDVIDESRALPLHDACERGYCDIVRLLLSHSYATSLLHTFEKTINGSTYEFVCDLNAVDEACRTSLHCAVENGHLELVKWLLEVDGANIIVVTCF